MPSVSEYAPGACGQGLSKKPFDSKFHAFSIPTVALPDGYLLLNGSCSVQAVKSLIRPPLLAAHPLKHNHTAGIRSPSLEDHPRIRSQRILQSLPMRTSMNRLIRIAIVFCVVALPGCTSGTNETRYLRQAQDRVTQDEIRERWGESKNVRPVDTGGSVWVYEKREQQAGNRYTAPGIWCDEYVLTFDQDRILRHWTHRSEFHGGELMPKECITGTPYPKGDR